MKSAKELLLVSPTAIVPSENFTIDVFSFIISQHCYANMYYRAR